MNENLLGAIKMRPRSHQLVKKRVQREEDLEMSTNEANDPTKRGKREKSEENPLDFDQLNLKLNIELQCHAAWIQTVLKSSESTYTTIEVRICRKVCDY